MADFVEKTKKQFLRVGVVTLMGGLGFYFMVGLGWVLLSFSVVFIAWGLLLKNVIESMKYLQNTLVHRTSEIKILEKLIKEGHSKEKEAADYFSKMSRKVPDFIEAYSESAENQYQEIQSELIQIEAFQRDAVDQASQRFRALGEGLEKHSRLIGGRIDVSKGGGNLFSMVHFESFVSQTEGLLDEFVNTILNTSKSSMKLLEKLESIEKMMSEIRNDISGIDTISEQTQVLSINASIESARVGVSGRGFGVVATEISHLSEYSKTFGERISSHIDEMQETIKEVGKSASEISFIDMGFAFAARKNIADMTEEIEAAEQKWNKDLGQLTCLNEEIASNANAAVSALQFEGLTRELFDSIKNRIVKMETGLAQIGSHEKSFEREEKLYLPVESPS
ncbi:MAG: methyl-accepting chemotaxis protein [Nitrospiria bacterium]